MSKKLFIEFHAQVKNKMNVFLETVFKECEADPVAQAARYSLMGGGKRIRPLLSFIVGEMLSVDEDYLIPFAAAIEMIHTYSLIHDDLPCMDNDVLRRGRATCHIQYGEATALLAGDALLNGAYEILLGKCLSGQMNTCRASQFIAQSAGIKGMIGGQSEDIQSELDTMTSARLYALHRKKTGALLSASVMLPFLLKGDFPQQEETRRQLLSFSEHLGLCYQIKDDLLDVLSTSAALGKTPGKDQVLGKATFVTLFGLDKAELLFQEQMKKIRLSLCALSQMGYNTILLESLTRMLEERES